MTLARRVAANAVTALGLQSALLVLGLAATAVFVRFLGLERYGVWAVLMAIVACGGVLELGLGVSLVRRVAALHGAGDRSGLSLALGATVTATAVLGAAGAGLIMVAAPLIATVVRVPAGLVAEFVLASRVGAVAVFLTVPSAALGATPRPCSGSMPSWRLRPPSPRWSWPPRIAVVLAGGSLVGLAAVMVVGRAASLVGRVALARHLLGGLGLRVRLRYPFWAELGRFGTLKVIQQIASLLVQHLDRLLVAVFLSAPIVAFYAAPLDLAQRLLMVQTNVSSAFYPAACAAAADRPAFLRLYERTSRAVTAATFGLAMVLIVFAGPILGAWVGPEMAARSANLLRVLAIAYALMALTAIPSSAADALNRPEIAARYSVAGLAINVTLAVILIPRFARHPRSGAGDPRQRRATGTLVLPRRGAVTRSVVGVPLWPYALRQSGSRWCRPPSRAPCWRGPPRRACRTARPASWPAPLSERPVSLSRCAGCTFFDAAEGEVLAELPGGRLLRWLAGAR